MQFSEWEPTYAQILADFGWQRSADEKAARLLSKLVEGDAAPPEILEKIIRGKSVLVVGPAAPKIPEVRNLQSGIPHSTIICAGSAASALRAAKIIPDILVTDLDGNVEDQIFLNILRRPSDSADLESYTSKVLRRPSGSADIESYTFNKLGAIAVIHAHGDNVDALRRWVPEFSGAVIATTQAAPLPNVYNFGGFTDGDRAVCIAAHFGAKRIAATGFDFENPIGFSKNIEIKKKKLAWAKRILEKFEISYF